jgi:tRNA nucleotidyltransferase (CCA-adding enzyme)
MATKLVIDIARAVRATAGGRAVIVGGWVRDRIMNLPGKANRTSISRSFASRRLGCVSCSSVSAGVEAVGESFQVYKLGAIDISLPRRDSKAGRGHRGFVVVGDPTCRSKRRRGGAISRSTPSRGIRSRTNTSIRSTAAATSNAPAADGRRATFADDSLRVLRAIQFVARLELRARRADSRCVARSRSTTCRRSGSGASSKSCCSPTPVDRVRARHGSRRRRQAVSRAAGAGRLPAGT